VKVTVSFTGTKPVVISAGNFCGCNSYQQEIFAVVTVIIELEA